MELETRLQAPILVETVSTWLMEQALSNTDLESIVNGCCNRLEAAGIPIARANMSFATLHPLYRAMGFTWRRGGDFEVEGYRHVVEGETDRFTQSPYFHLIDQGLDHMRCRLDIGSQYDFPILADLRKEGLTDYLAFRSEFDGEGGRGMIGSWCTDREGGFSDRDLAGLLRIKSRLAVACKMAMQNSLTKNMMTTYLGLGAGERVLDGQIRRGDGDTIRAAIVMADIRGSTDMADRLGRQDYIDALNTFFDNVAGSYADLGGEVLSFIGDGFLAIFPCERHRKQSQETCAKAFKATRQALARMEKVNQQRKADGEDPIRFGIALHIGNVMFGNVGMEDRLTFSVFGTSVNATSRLEQLTKTYATPLIASDEFVGYCAGEWRELGQEKLRGVERPMVVYTSDAAVDEKPSAQERRSAFGMSDAENVILLQRRKPFQQPVQKKEKSG